MKKSIKVVAFFLFFAVFTLGCNNKDAEASTYGENISLSEFQGKVVIVDFWATWCPPCRKGVPDLIQLQNENDQVVVIGISLDAVSRGGATANDVVPFMKEYGINYPIVKGDMNVIQQYGGIQSIPTSFVIDRRGFVVARHVGLASIETYRSDIEKALAGNYNREDYIKAPDFSLPTIK
jgi:cytochrome c biogenesis protein CcmG/thiol:disulfide interchange protein DsbE